MANEYPSRRVPDDLKSVEFARADGSIRRLTPRDGTVRAQDAADDAVLASYRYPVATDAAPKASKTAKATAARQAKAAERKREREAAAAAEAAEANREVGDPPAETTSEGTN